MSKPKVQYIPPGRPWDGQADTFVVEVSYDRVYPTPDNTGHAVILPYDEVKALVDDLHRAMKERDRHSAQLS